MHPHNWTRWQSPTRYRIQTTIVAVCLATFCGFADAQQLILSRGPATVVVTPYAPNILRVSISLDKDRASAGPGYGLLASPSTSGWAVAADPTGDTLSSTRMVARVAAQGPPRAPTGTSADIAKFFGGSTPWIGLTIKTPAGATLLDMRGWQMSIPNHKDGNAGILYDRRPQDDPFFEVGASFAAPDDEHYYGLGQNQEGYLDRRGHVLRCAHDYNAPGGQSVCVPFVVTNKGYGIVWDNPSRTTVRFRHQRHDSMDVRCRSARLVLCHRGRDLR